MPAAATLNRLLVLCLCVLLIYNPCLISAKPSVINANKTTETDFESSATSTLTPTTSTTPSPPESNDGRTTPPTEGNITSDVVDLKAEDHSEGKPENLVQFKNATAEKVHISRRTVSKPTKYILERFNQILQWGH